MATFGGVDGTIESILVVVLILPVLQVRICTKRRSPFQRENDSGYADLGAKSRVSGKMLSHLL